MGIESHALGAIVQPGTPLEEIQLCLNVLIEHHRAINWQIGDLVIAAQKTGGDQWDRQLPGYVHPDMLSRYSAVSAAYTLDERNIDANWTIHMQKSKHVDRVALVAATADAGQTSDESRKNPVTVVPDDSPAVTPESSPPAEEPTKSKGWLLCVDISYYIRRSYDMDGVATAGNVFDKIIKLRDRLHTEKNLSDIVICFDSPNSRRRLLTEGWKKPYKSRGKKEDELISQFISVRQMFERINVTCVDVDGEEADDIMASYAVQFDGMVSLMTSDADLRQCLKEGKCNILLDTTWEQHPETAKWRHVDHWVNEAKHLKEGCAKYKYDKESNVTGITPQQWPHLQAIAGDTTDDIAGCVGLGGKYACDLIKAHGTVQNVIAAAKDGSADLTAKKIESVLAFEPFAETTLLLTTMRTDLQVPMVTKLAMKEDS